ncbi:MAG: hypothetical protein ACJ79K_10970 [Gemmatimonadaceae bacterium]
MPAVARLRGTVDVATGTLTFDPVSSSGVAIPNGVNAAIYGDQGINVRLYNSAVVTSTPTAGKKTYTANVGIRNLLAFRIGDEQNLAAPLDTMGIYVFTNAAPVVSGTSSPCSCTVTVKNRVGTLDFSSTNQAYWYWPELLGPAGGGRDTTLARKTWVFEADTQVTRFNFDVLVSAAWSSPNETVWKITYPGDSLPDTQAEPRWHMASTQGGPAETISAGALVIDLKKTKDTLVYVRHDSVSTTTDALIEGRFRLDDGGNSTVSQLGIAIDDDVRYLGLFVSDSSASGRARVGFVDATGNAFDGTSDTVSNVKNFRVYQLRKYGADSAVIYVDGVRRLKATYAVLPLTKNAGSPYVEFGFTNGTTRTTRGTFSYVTYQIGRATP